MSDHVVIHAIHPFIMRNREAIRQTIQFLHTGRFDHGADRLKESAANPSWLSPGRDDNPDGGKIADGVEMSESVSEKL